MAPNYESYSSLLDGSFRIVSAKNASKHGSGTAQIQNSIDLFGSDNQFVKSSNVSADLSVQSAKSLNLSSVATSHLTGQNVNLTSTSDSTLKCTTGAMIVEATAGDCTVKASSASTLYLAGKIKDESFTSTLCKSVADYTIKSSGANATLQADNLEARVFGHSLAHIRGNQATKLESTNGKVDIVGKTDIDIKAVNILNEATTKATVSAPEVDINSANIVKVEGPTVQIGLTSDNVNISLLGKQTTINGNCTIAGNLEIKGTTTSVNTTEILVKDNLMVLNSASQVGKDAGLLFNRNGADATSMYWSEADKEFVFASTDSTHDAINVVKKDLQNVRAKKIIADAVEINGFKSFTFELADNSVVPLELVGLKNRGVYNFQIESVADSGCVYDYKVCKGKTDSDSFTSFGVHQPAFDTNEEISIKWEANSPPSVYHSVVKNAGTGALISYVCKYLSVN